MILPPSWATILQTLRPAFARRGTFALFCVLATRMVAQSSRRSVVGMLSGARMASAVLVQSLVIVWYAVSGYHRDDVTERRQAEPWYDAKTEPSFEDTV